MTFDVLTHHADVKGELIAVESGHDEIGEE
jgi:hypothetical protein